MRIINRIKGAVATPAYHKAEEVSHLIYFALIVAHGPYYLAAAVCLLVGALSLLIGEDSHV